MKGGNGESAASVVTLCSNCAYQNDAAENLLGSRTKSAEEISRSSPQSYKSGREAFS